MWMNRIKCDENLFPSCCTSLVEHGHSRYARVEDLYKGKKACGKRNTEHSQRANSGESSISSGVMFDMEIFSLSRPTYCAIYW